MKMAVGMHQILMGMNVLVNQVHPKEKIKVVEDLGRRPFRRKRMPFLQDRGAVGVEVRRVQVAVAVDQQGCSSGVLRENATILHGQTVETTAARSNHRGLRGPGGRHEDRLSALGLRSSEQQRQVSLSSVYSVSYVVGLPRARVRLTPRRRPP